MGQGVERKVEAPQDTKTTVATATEVGSQCEFRYVPIKMKVKG